MKRFLTYLVFLVSTALFFIYPAFSEEQLIIVNLWPDERSRSVEERLKKEEPGLQIEYLQVEDRQVLTTRFLSMDSEMDIVCFSEWDGIEGMYAAMEGAIENLNQYPSLVNSRDKQFAIWKNYTLDDVWYGVPCSPYQSLVFLNTSLWEKLDIPLPNLHWTWDDFWALAQRVEEYNNEHQTQYALFMDDTTNSAAAQYAANTVDYKNKSHRFDDDTFCQFIEKWKGMYDRGLIWDYMYNKNQGGTYDESKTLMIFSETNFSGAGILSNPYAVSRESFSIRLLPQNDEMQPSVVSGYELVIPVASKHKELAARWLTYYMDAGESDTNNTVYNSGPLYRDTAYLSALKEGKDEETIEKLDLWIYGLEHSCLFPYNDLTHAVTVRFWWQLRDGQITVQDYISACVRLANQYLGE